MGARERHSLSRCVRGLTYLMSGAIGLLVAGCADVTSLQKTLWANRYGPDASMVAEEVAQTASRQMLVLDGLRNASGLQELPSIKSPNWYLIAVAGYNYVDEKCDAYLQDVFIAERQRDRTTGALDLIGAATGAVLVAALDKRRASLDAIAITAQAFGLSSQLIKTFANSYLYNVPSTVVYDKVTGLRAAYRAKVDTDQAGLGGGIRSPTAAYQSIRSYLSICMPDSIDAAIHAVVANSTPEANTPATAPGKKMGGAATSIVTTKLVAPASK